MVLRFAVICASTYAFLMDFVVDLDRRDGRRAAALFELL
jgi:hypothetical protein